MSAFISSYSQLRKGLGVWPFSLLAHAFEVGPGMCFSKWLVASGV